MNKLARKLSTKQRQNSYYDNASNLIIPSIIVTGVTGVVGDITYPLKQRGFLPIYALANPETSSSTLVLKMSPKLYMKTAIELGYPLLDITDSKHSHVARVHHKSLSILMRMKEQLNNFDKAWLMQELKVINRKEEYANNQELLNDVNTYYGSKTALFFAYQFFLQQYMLMPSCFGAVLFGYQVFLGQVDTRYNPIFMVTIMFWILLLMRLWYRENSSLCFEWGVAEADENRKIKETAEVRVTDHPSKKPMTEWWRMGVLIVVQLVSFVLVLQLMLYFLHWVEVSVAREGGCDSGSGSVLTMYPLLLYSVLSWATGALFNELAVYLHKNDCREYNHGKHAQLIWTTFTFHFFNNNCGLVYASFYARDLVIVQYLLVSLVIVTTLFDYLLYEIYLEQRVIDSETNISKMLVLEGKSLLPSISDSEADEKWKVLVLDELKRLQFHPHLRHLRLTTRYSFCCMFVVAFPITPLLMWFYNGLDPKLYLQKLNSSVRVHVVDTSSLSEWLNCLKFINFAAVIVNSFLLCILTSDLSLIIPAKYEAALQESETNRFLLMILLEHAVVLVEVLLSYMLEMVPQGVQLKVAKEKMESLNTLIHERLAMYQFIGKTVLEDRAKESAERKSSAETLESKYSTKFGYNPYLLLGVVISPLLCISLGISQFIFIPICILYFSYLKNSKDRHDIMAAAGVISDENVLRYIQQEMPSWISSSDVERAMWMDSTLQTLWPGISKASESWLVDRLQPLLLNTQASMIPNISINELNLGAISPRITGVRNIKTTESMVRLDIEFIWAGTPEIELEVGKNLNLEIRKLFFSCKMRVELGPLVSVFPTFGAVSVSFMGKPKIDFSFKVGGLDIMNIGIASTDYSIAMLVGDYMKSCLEFMVYPKKCIVPMVADCDIDKLVKLIPVGILKLTIVSAKDLIVADFITKSSDPYVVIKFMDNKLKTRTIFKNLNPTWNETFDLMIYDKETQSVLFEVFDYDFSSNITKAIAADDLLGRATLNLDRIQMSKPTEFQLMLHDTKSGSLDVICEYCPLKKNGRAKYSEEDIEGRDVIFHYSPEAFTTDILEEEPTPLLLSSDEESFLSDMEDDDDDDHDHVRPSSTGTPMSKRRTFDKFLNPFQSNNHTNTNDNTNTNTDTDEQRSPRASKENNTPPRKRTSSSVPSSRRSSGINETTEARFRRSVTNSNGQHGKRGAGVGGVLSVNHMSCRNLEKSTQKMTRKLRPYIEVSVENQVKRTESKPKIKNPCFEETFNFLVANSNVGIVKFKILNEFSIYKDVCIGRFSIEVNEVKSAGKLEKQFILDGNSEGQIFNCTLQWVEVAS